MRRGRGRQVAQHPHRDPPSSSFIVSEGSKYGLTVLVFLLLVNVFFITAGFHNCRFSDIFKNLVHFVLLLATEIFRIMISNC